MIPRTGKMSEAAENNHHARARFVSQISTGIIQLNIDELLLVDAYFLILILLRLNVIEYSIA